MYSTIRWTPPLGLQLKFSINYKCNIVIWNANIHKGFTPPSQGIWQWLVLNNTKPTHLKKKGSIGMQGLHFITKQTNSITKSNCVYQINGEINPSSIWQPKSTNVWWLKKVQSPHDWWQNAFNHCKFGDQKHFVNNHVAMENFRSLHD
jgi:hypothetical protein